MSEQSETLRKAAILIDGLDQQAADLLLARLPDDCAAGIRDALRQLGRVDPHEREKVVQEFQHWQAAPPYPVADGVELSEPLAEKLGTLDDAEIGEPAPAEFPPADDSARGPFAFLDTTPTERLVRCLAQELPQTACIVLAHLPPWRGAELLARLPDARRADLVRRLSRLERTEPTVVAEVAQGLRETLDSVPCEEANRPVGQAVLEAILQAAGDAQRQTLLEHLDPENLRPPPTASDPTVTRSASEWTEARHASEWTEARNASEWTEARNASEWTETRGASEWEGRSRRPRCADLPHGREAVLAARTTPDEKEKLLRILVEPPPDRNATEGDGGVDPTTELPDAVLGFDDFGELEDAALAKVFRAADAQITLLALCGASRELIDRILQRLPPRESRALCRKLEQLGPTRLSDIESAQRQLAELASHMADEGQIQVPSHRRFTIAV
jgi:flagellar motor switch protein FliG